MFSLWLGRRQAQGNAQTTVTVTTGDGRSVTVTSAQAGEAERLLRLALEARRHPMARHPLPGLQRAGAAAPAGRRATASAPPGGPCPT
ncbi:effector-associated constant component EACC1, partial [Streptomyces silaceus]|uniref:effector-associated constant component EACC1 n=1 Tax=Streptomyces silaceus TaxID=545123 RepID=UPI003CC67019